MRLSRALLQRSRVNDRLNGGSSMTLGCKGLVVRPIPHRLRMPWVAPKEPVPRRVLLHKDKVILEGKHLPDADAIDRSSMADPLDILQGAVAQYQFNISNGKNLLQLASSVPCDGRGQRVYRKEWREGTYEKHITISAVEFDRDGNAGSVYGYVTFHGESSLTPVKVEHADIPGWVMEFDEGACVPLDEVVSPPPSIGTEVPVDPKKYRLKAYPFYDPPNPAVFVQRLLKDRGVLPDPPGGDAESVQTEDRSDSDGSVHVS